MWKRKGVKNSTVERAFDNNHFKFYKKDIQLCNPKKTQELRY